MDGFRVTMSWARDRRGARGVGSVPGVILLLVALSLLLPAVGRADDAAWRLRRERMLEDQIEARGVANPRVLAAIRRVPRHLFVPEQYRDYAYADHPLQIGHGQTISQPYIVALMTDLADISPGDNVLEVGTGSGYQAAVLAQMGVHVRTIEIIESLSRRARALLEQLGYDRVEFRTGDGYAGWPEAAPFDAIVVTAAPDHVPGPLRDQLALGGRLVIPVGRSLQNLLVITRTEEGFREEEVIPVRFVPMTGKAQEP